MTSSLEEAENYHKANRKGTKQYIHLTPFLEETEREWDVLQEDKYPELIEASPTVILPIFTMDQYPTLMLPLIRVEQLPTLSRLKAMPKSSQSTIGIPDGLSIYEQPTWIIPVLPDTRKKSKAAFQEIGVGSPASILRNLVKSSGIYALSSLASPLVSLVLAPFLTHSLSRSDYGALAVLNTVIALLAGITQFGLNAAFTRAYNFDYEAQRDRLDVLSTTVVLLSLISILTAFSVVIAAPWLSSLLLGSSSFTALVRVVAVVVLMQNLALPGLAWLHAENRAILFSTVSMLNLLVTAVSTIVFVGVLHMGIAGALLAIGSGYAVIVVCTLPIIVLWAGLRLRFDIAWGMLIFGFPNVINLVSGWVLQLSDRYLLSHYGSLSQTASYAVAYTLGGVLSSVIIAPFSLAWWSIMFPIAKRDDAPRIFRLIFRWFSFALLLAAFGLSRIGIIILDLFFPPAYHASAPIIPIIALSILFNGLYVVVSAGISLQRKTWLAAIFFTLSALINVGLNLFFIPAYGAMGAAFSTLIAYAALALMGYIANQRLYPVPFEIGRFIAALVVGLVLYLGSDAIARGQGEYVAWSIHFTALVLYGGCLLMIGMLPDRQYSQ